MKYSRQIELMAMFYQHKAHDERIMNPDYANASDDNIRQNVDCIQRAAFLSALYNKPYEVVLFDHTFTFKNNDTLLINGAKVNCNRDTKKLNAQYKHVIVEQFAQRYQKEYLPLKHLADQLEVKTDLQDSFDAYVDQYLERYETILPLFNCAQDLLQQFAFSQENGHSIFSRAAKKYHQTEYVREKISLIEQGNALEIANNCEAKELPALLFMMAADHPDRSSEYRALGQAVYQAMYQGRNKLIAFIADDHQQWCERHTFLKPLVKLVVAVLALFISQQKLTQARSVVAREYSSEQLMTLSGKTAEQSSSTNLTRARFFMPIDMAHDVQNKLNNPDHKMDSLYQSMEAICNRNATVTCQ